MPSVFSDKCVGTGVSPFGDYWNATPAGVYSPARKFRGHAQNAGRGSDWSVGEPQAKTPGAESSGNH